MDVQPELRRRIRLAAARRDLTVQQYLKAVIEAQLDEDLSDGADSLTGLRASVDPVLAELWDNAKDAEYDRL
jgi:hypothetical protein